MLWVQSNEKQYLFSNIVVVSKIVLKIATMTLTEMEIKSLLT